MSPRFDLGHPDVAHLLWVQDGVVTRRQLLERGATPADIRRLVRRRELRRVHQGVYVDHTGRLTRRQREWIAVLSAWPAALARETALPDRASSRVVHIAIAHGRRVVAPSWVRVQRVTRLTERADLTLRPARMRLEHALIDVMSDRIGADDVPGAFAVLARTVASRRTDAPAVLAALATRGRVAHRRDIEGLLTDLRDGACSVLERGYLHRVERAHGLPRAWRQHRSGATGKRTDQDVHYVEYGVVVELDGRAFHDSAEARDNDARRDIAELATSDAVTARVTYGLVFGDACRTAMWIGRILQRRGWRGAVRPCPECRSR